MFRAEAERRVPDLCLRLGGGGALVPVLPAARARLQRLLETVGDWARRCPGAIAEEAARSHAERELLDAFFEGLGSGDGHTLGACTTLSRRLHRLRQAQDYLVEHAGEAVYLDDLCSHLKMSRRGVEALFMDLLGVSPVRYLRQLRLHGARRALLQGSRDRGRVKQVALDWGHWHFGRFSQEYRELFGELPSATVGRARG
jgi:AraC family ethanolamine operon transcriptional activator